MAKGINRYVDILIVTALVEERFLLDRVFPEAFIKTFTTATIDHEKIDIEDRSVDRVSIQLDSRTLCVAWTTLGSRATSEGDSMGNVFAYDAIMRLTDLLSPRFVLLFGIAGGSPSVFKRGDVGFGTVSGYSSSGKITAFTSVEEAIRRTSALDAEQKADLLAKLTKVGVDPTQLFPKYDIRVNKKLESSETFCVAARNKARDTGNWTALANKWFCKKIQNDFKAQSFAKDYPDQNTFERKPPGAYDGLVASGDTIIANKELQRIISNELKDVDYHSKRNIPANMFEMESFGVALFCKARKIGYGIIKGICDLAGYGKNDEFRLCAQSSAAAFALAIITDKGFYETLLDAPNERFGSGRNACIWPCDGSSYSRCVGNWPESEDRFLVCYRPCNESPLLKLPTGSELVGARLFQHTKSIEYSACVENLIKDGLKSQKRDHTYRMVLLFPYSVQDLLIFFYNTKTFTADDRGKILELQRFLPDGNNTAEEQVSTHAIYLGEKAYQHHAHFDASNRICAEWIASGMGFEEIAQQICRVICIREEDKQYLIQDPRFLMHVFMCGLCVPTLIASKGAIEDYGTDEATYWNCRATSDSTSIDPVSSAGGNTLCLKYSDRSKLLALLGRCDAKPHSSPGSAAFDMFTDIEKWISRNLATAEPAGNASRYEVFPALQLLRHHNVVWQRYETLVPSDVRLGDARRAKVDHYFDELLKREQKLPDSQ